MRLTGEKRGALSDLWYTGCYSKRSIARIIGCHESTVRYWINRDAERDGFTKLAA
jgi:transposase